MRFLRLPHPEDEPLEILFDGHSYTLSGDQLVEDSLAEEILDKTENVIELDIPAAAPVTQMQTDKVLHASVSAHTNVEAQTNEDGSPMTPIEQANALAKNSVTPSQPSHFPVSQPAIVDTATAPSTANDAATAPAGERIAEQAQVTAPNPHQNTDSRRVIPPIASRSEKINNQKPTSNVLSTSINDPILGQNTMNSSVGANQPVSEASTKL